MRTASKLQRIKQRIDNQATILVSDYMDYISHEPHIERQTKKYVELEEKWQKWLHKQTKTEYVQYRELFCKRLTLTLQTANTYYAEQQVKSKAEKKTLRYKWKNLVHRVVMGYVNLTTTKKTQ